MDAGGMGRKRSRHPELRQHRVVSTGGRQVHERVQQRFRICGDVVCGHACAVNVAVAITVAVLVLVRVAVLVALTVDSSLRQRNVRHRMMQFTGRPDGRQQHQARKQRRDERGAQGSARGAQAGRGC